MKPFGHCQITKEGILCFLRFRVTTARVSGASRDELESAWKVSPGEPSPGGRTPGEPGASLILSHQHAARLCQ